jgi:hypothetical protein
LEVWKKNGGEPIELTGKAADDYLADVTEVAKSILSQNSAAFADYNTLLAASKKYH